MGRENSKAYTEHTKNKIRNDDLKKELESSEIASKLFDVCDTVICLKPVKKTK